jgi:hypothetical protein
MAEDSPANMVEAISPPPPTPKEVRYSTNLVKVVSDSYLNRESSPPPLSCATEHDTTSTPRSHPKCPDHQSSAPLEFVRQAPRMTRSAQSLPPAMRQHRAAVASSLTANTIHTNSHNNNINHHASLNMPVLLHSASNTMASKKVYRAADATTSTSKWVTRDIAALDFLLNIPLQAEGEIVRAGYLLHQQQQRESQPSSYSYEENNNSSHSNHHQQQHQHKQYYNQQQQEIIDDDEDDTSGAITHNHQPYRNSILYNTVNHTGNSNSKGTWWEKWIKPSDIWSSHKPSRFATDDSEQLERPDASDSCLDQRRLHPSATKTTPGNNVHANTPNNASTTTTVPTYVPGRRLEGDTAIRIHAPLSTDSWTRQKSFARQAAMREWELATAHGLRSNQPPLLEGRLFFSASGSYPLSVCSILRYEPKKEEAALRRQKLEARGGGGTHFFMPARDWRGISYRALLPRRAEKNRKAFNRFLKQNYHYTGNDDDDDNGASNHDNKHNHHKDRKPSHDRMHDSESDHDDSDSSVSSESSDDSDVYVPGLLDDPEMVLGRHHTVMMGDRVIGPIVSSTIQFVKPALLKVELNKQFRERFDGWEPPKSARKYIGARVVDGEYKLMDPATATTATSTTDDPDDRSPDRRMRQGSTASSLGSESSGTTAKEKVIRMPPSLTLSKIRSLKLQALAAVVKAKAEISTLALACVYFERLCLDCRVDKSNRRLCFAASLLLAAKINEPNITLVMKQQQQQQPPTPGGSEAVVNKIQSMVRPNQRSSIMFASLLEFFTQDWNLSLKHLFDAEWGVFAALGFSLNATPSQVAFHFKRFMKILEWNPLTYLGPEMYRSWQSALAEEEDRRRAQKVRMERRRRRKERRLLNLHIELENELRRKNEVREKRMKIDDEMDYNSNGENQVPSSIKVRKSGMSIFHRFGMRRSNSQERISADGSAIAAMTDHGFRRKQIPLSPSMPALSAGLVVDKGSTAVDTADLPEEFSIASTNGSENSNKGIIV